MKIETLISLLQLMAAKHPGSMVIVHQFERDQALIVKMEDSAFPPVIRYRDGKVEVI